MLAKLRLISEYILLACKPRNITNLFVLARYTKNRRDIFKLLLGKEIVLYYQYNTEKTFALSIRDINDLGIMFEIFVTRIYRFPARMPYPKVMLDIGGHVGFFTILSHYLYPEAHIYTFEPDPSNFSQLQKNLALNAIGHEYVHINNYGIGKENTTVQLYQDYRGSDKTLYPTSDTIASVAITIRTLDDVLNDYNIEHIDVLKIDIEGSEYDLFESWGFEGLKNISCFFLEIHLIKGHSMNTLIHHIKSSFTIHRQKRIVHYFANYE